MSAGYPQRLAATFTPLVIATSVAESTLDDPLLLTAVGVASAAITAVTALALGRCVAGVAAEVSRFADRVAAGELSARVEHAGRGELGRLVASINAMAARLAREQHARAQFIGRVSHELRTPVTVIKGYVYTLRRGEADPARAGRLDVIDGECERLAYLVEDLLELARAQVGELRLSSDTFPLRECVEEVAERLRAVAAQRNVGIEVSWQGNGALVRGDENRVRQIFANLVTNGIKYAPPQTSVTVRGDATGGDLRVSVEDCGRGIADADLPFVFDEFFQAPERSEPGAGLGLAIARELAEAHGGRIDVASSVGNGARFTVTLPAWSGAA